MENRYTVRMTYGLHESFVSAPGRNAADACERAIRQEESRYGVSVETAHARKVA